MTFREKVKRVFRSSKNTAKPKIEYYRRHECPPSKFRGPFDRAHQKSLAAWSFQGAMVERPRSFEVSLSPFATCEGSDGYSGPSESDNSVSPEDVDPVSSNPEIPAESSPRGPGSGSQSSTIVDPSSYNGSMMTLINEGSIYEIPEDSKDPKFFLKESIRYSSPLVHAISPALTPCVISARKHLPFAPEDLARALIAIQVCA
ncbi:Peroxidase family protein [Penicillium digitatum]|uniref:Uncharacterized protein n=3 Tax=Penicillium digitatum TaxID=36651 RepID=K9FFV8_PEND2|nr:hypothetical protein PDIP_46030 [Penicillium digitatum Pd1]EKV07042.1 hypothetical protein PDIG_75560 [Penicillium digitatum PHI26]EKV13965.1 hypothetical protein PDIP_46030 [Penicillium digitatum Pd1]KAG0160863.1 hypothetical protein PDIDSM_8395 [Penicillium digitatum]QQK46261.1 Peroxidase family protein [Penicillium digitatum]